MLVDLCFYRKIRSDQIIFLYTKSHWLGFFLKWMIDWIFQHLSTMKCTVNQSILKNQVSFSQDSLPIFIDFEECLDSVRANNVISFKKRISNNLIFCIFSLVAMATSNNINVSFSGTKSQLNPKECPVNIIGKAANLKKITFDDLSCKFSSLIDQKVCRKRMKFLSKTFNFYEFLWISGLGRCYQRYWKHRNRRFAHLLE